MAERQPVITQPTSIPAASNVVNADAYSSAQNWTKIAAVGADLAKEGVNELRLAEHQRQVGYLAANENEIERKRTELRDANNNNPQGFDSSWKGYTEGKLSTAEPWAVPHLKRKLGHEGNSAYSAILNEKRSTDQGLDSQAITARANMTAGDVIGHAMQGTFNSPEGQIALEKHKAVLATAVTSKLMAPEEAERRLVDLSNRAAAEVTIKTIGDTYRDNRANGDVAGPEALRQAEGLILRGNLKLSEEQRYAYYHKATAEIRALEAERKGDLQLARQAKSDAEYAMARGVRVSPETIDSTVEQLNRAGGQAESARLRASAARFEEMSAFGRLPLGDQVNQFRAASVLSAVTSPAGKQAQQFFVDKGYTPAQAAGIVGNLAHESHLSTTVRGDPEVPGGSVGLAQWNRERLDRLQQFAQARGKPASDFQTQLEFVAHELDTTESTAKSAVKAATTPEEAAKAFIHFERPRGYSPDRPEAGHGYASRVAAAQAAAGQAVIGPGIDPRLAVGQQKELDSNAATAWGNIVKGFDAGVRPTPQALAEVQQAFVLTGNHEKLEEMAARIDRHDAKVSAGRTPLGVQEGAATELERVGAVQGLEPGQQAWLKDLRSVNSATAEKLSSDPVGLGVERFPERFKTPAPLVVTNSEAMRGGLAERAGISRFVAQNYAVPAVSALRPADVQAVQAALEQSDARGKARIFSDLSTLPEDIRHATLAQLGQKGPDQMVQVYAGALYARAPDIAESILRGQGAMTSDPRNNPIKEDKSGFNDALDKYLPQSAFTLAGRTNPSGSYATMRQAAIARYADLTAQDPKGSKDLNEDRLKKSIEDVTGGVLSHNGGSLIAPRRGMTQAQFDATVGGVNDADLAGVTTLHGEPVTAGYLRNNARLESLSDGRYLVQIGNDPANPLYAVRDAGTEMPAPFVLDLRDRNPDANYRRQRPGVEFQPYPRG